MVDPQGDDSGSRAAAPRCWCGERPCRPFSDDYVYCDACGTLVLRHPPDPEALLVKDDASDFYGRSYYETYLTDRYKYPPLSERARRDLGERCLHWLRALLKYRLPPATVLELGSAHGGFVALMRQAGYKAAGLEVSPSVVKLARRTFGVPMLLGPLERQRVAPRSLDVVVLMDVIEHLLDPLATLRRCLRLLRPDGLILVQTPGYPDGKSLDELRGAGDRFVEQLKPAEHLFLYSERAIRTLLERLGVKQVSFEPAIFAHYDMFLAASRAPLVATSSDLIDKALTARPASRFVLALLDLDGNRREAVEAVGRRIGEAEAERGYATAERDHHLRQVQDVEADRAARLKVIEEQGRRLGQVESEHDKALSAQADLRARLEVAEAEVVARVTEAEQLARRLREAEQERDTALAEFGSLRQQVQRAEADLGARQETIEDQGRRLHERERERDLALAELGDLRRQIEVAAADTAARLAEIERQGETVRRLEIECADAALALSASQGRVDAQQAELDALAIRLAAVELDRSGSLRLLARQADQLADGATEFGNLSRRHDHLRQRVESLEQAGAVLRYEREQLHDRAAKLGAWRDSVLAVLSALRRSRVLKAYRLVGGWKAMDAATTALLQTAPKGVAAAVPPVSKEDVKLPDRQLVTRPQPAPLPEVESAPSYAEAERLAERLAAFVWRPDFFRIWERHGVHVTPAHFYSPIPVVSNLEAAPWPGPVPLTGIDMREPQQLALLDECRKFESEYLAFADTATESPFEYFRDQPMLRVVDAEVLHCLVRRSKPKRIIEVGSGFSTYVTAAALLKNAADGHPARFVAIEPYPNDVLRAGIPGLSELRVEPVQSLPAAFADELDENDILFIDSSHVVRIDSDVRFLFLEVLPRLKPGVLVHVHDVFLPAEYPRGWVIGEQRFWNEQYLLHALLLFSRGFEVVWAGSFMHMVHPDALARAFPAYDRKAAWPGSFWLRRVAEGEDTRS